MYCTLLSSCYSCSTVRYTLAITKDKYGRTRTSTWVYMFPFLSVPIMRTACEEDMSRWWNRKMQTKASGVLFTSVTPESSDSSEFVRWRISTRGSSLKCVYNIVLHTTGQLRGEENSGGCQLMPKMAAGRAQWTAWPHPTGQQDAVDMYYYSTILVQYVRLLIPDCISQKHHQMIVNTRVELQTTRNPMFSSYRNRSLKGRI